MRALLMAVLALLVFQENPEELVRQLADGGLEERESATNKLIWMGEAAREALFKATKSGNGELRVRAEQILKTLDIQKEVRAFLAPASRVSISGDLTLQEAMKDLEKQSGHKIECETWPEGKFHIDLKNASSWDALESICAASGKRTPELTVKGIKLTGARYLRKARIEQGNITVRIDTVELGREFEFTDRTEKRFLALYLVVGWERSIVPVCSYWDIQSALDDQGVDHKKSFDDFADTGASGTPFSAEDPKSAYSQKFCLVTYDPPKERASVIPELKGKITLWLKASPDLVSLPFPRHEDIEEEENRKEVSESIRVFDTELMTKPGVKVTLVDSGSVKIEGVDRRMLRDGTHVAYVTDRQKRRYPCDFNYDKESGTFNYWPSGMPEGAVRDQLVLRIPKRVVQVDIPFTLKDIPLK
jgi:hypothetical protein